MRWMFVLGLVCLLSGCASERYLPKEFDPDHPPKGCCGQKPVKQTPRPG